MRPVDRVVDKLGTTRVDLFVHLWKATGSVVISPIRFTESATLALVA